MSRKPFLPTVVRPVLVEETLKEFNNVASSLGFDIWDEPKFAVLSSAEAFSIKKQTTVALVGKFNDFVAQLPREEDALPTNGLLVRQLGNVCRIGVNVFNTERSASERRKVVQFIMSNSTRKEPPKKFREYTPHLLLGTTKTFDHVPAHAISHLATVVPETVIIGPIPDKE